MRQASTELKVATRGRGLYPVTRDITGFLRQTGIQNGLVTLHLRHTSASLVIQENADRDVCADLDRFFSALVPDGDNFYQHRSEGPDDMPAHIRTALTAVNLSIPAQDGNLVLGSWQGIYLWEHRLAGQQRRLFVHVLGD